MQHEKLFRFLTFKVFQRVYTRCFDGHNICK